MSLPAFDRNMFTQRVVMTQVNETESGGLASVRRESGVSATTETRGSRVFLRIPDCTARLSAFAREGAGWRSRLQSISELSGPWLDMVRPVAPPRVLAAGAIGILLGLVMIVLAPGKKPAPTVHTHKDQATSAQRPAVPPPPAEPNGARANVGTEGVDRAAKMAARPNAPATVSPSPPLEGARPPAGAPAKPYAVLENKIQ